MTPVTRSGFLTLIVERDLEEAPDDPRAWIMVLVCEGTSVPEHFGGGYLHRPDCECHQGGSLCDVGWLLEFVACVGVWPVVRDVADSLDPVGRYRLVGRMESDRYVSIESGVDFDDWFEVVEVTRVR